MKNLKIQIFLLPFIFIIASCGDDRVIDASGDDTDYTVDCTGYWSTLTVIGDRPETIDGLSDYFYDLAGQDIMQVIAIHKTGETNEVLKVAIIPLDGEDFPSAMAEALEQMQAVFLSCKEDYMTPSYGNSTSQICHDSGPPPFVVGPEPLRHANFELSGDGAGVKMDSGTRILATRSISLSVGKKMPDFIMLVDKNQRLIAVGDSPYKECYNYK